MVRASGEVKSSGASPNSRTSRIFPVWMILQTSIISVFMCYFRSCKYSSRPMGVR
jgi:hypothetical protein